MLVTYVNVSLSMVFDIKTILLELPVTASSIGEFMHYLLSAQLGTWRLESRQKALQDFHNNELFLLNV